MWKLWRNRYLFGLAFVFFGLSIGMIGYHYFEDMSWADSFINSAVILSGTSPLSMPVSVGAKIFAGVYALFGGLAFILVVGLVFGPVVQRHLRRHKIDR